MARFALASAIVVVGVAAGCGGHDDNTIDAATPTIDAPTVPADVAILTWPALATIPLTSPDGSFWGPEFHMGSQTFLMDLDTGSTTIGVAGASCSSCSSVGVTPRYTPGAGAMDTHNTASTQYADGSGWDGEIFHDSVGFAHNTPNISLDFAEITTQTDFFIDNTYQGILGLGGQANAEVNTSSYFDLATASGAVPIMAFELCSTTGTMWLGGFDPTKASAVPVYTPLLTIDDNNPFYAIDISAMSIGATSVGTGAATFQHPVVDTGTSFFYVPTVVENAVLAAVNASTGYKALFGVQVLADNGCVTAAGVTPAMVDAQLPALTMTMPGLAGGANVTITAKPMLSYLYDGGGGMFCFGMADGGNVDATTMGDQIMQAFVTIIDVKNNQVGFAPDIGCGGAPHRPIARATFHPHLPRPHHHR